jgi:hypothetical protein
MNTHYDILSVCVYDETSPLAVGDQILVPTRVWTAFDENHSGTGPIFVRVGDEGLVGRLRPATSADGLDGDCCRVPTAMWIRLGAPMPDEQCVHISAEYLPIVGSITLRAHRERSLTELVDPVVTLSTEIAANWSCVSEGQEIVLPCGTFDVMSLADGGGNRITAGSILNTDVNLELVPALDHRSPPATPMPTPAMGPTATPSSSLPNLTTDVSSRFIGRGYRLGSS